MKASSTQDGPLRRWLWFVGLWAAGVATAGLAALIIRGLMRAM